MPKFNADRLERFIFDALDAASAPPNSAKWRHTPHLLEELFMEGDTGDVWIVVSGLAETIIQTLNLRHAPCPCGNPAHRAEVQFGFAPMDDEGNADWENAYIGNPDEAPAAFVFDRPDLAAFARMVNAEIAEDRDRSLEIWREALEGGYWVRVLNIALKQAGSVRRQAVANSGAN